MKKLLHWEGNLKKVAKDIPVSTWTFWYHKPYRCDWRAAKIKAIDRMWRERGEKYGY